MIPAPSLAQWAAAFVLTLAVETPAVAWAFRGEERHLGRRLGAAIFATVATHPALVLLLPRLMRIDLPALAVAEIVVVVIEAGLYVVLLPVCWNRALAVSLVANAASFAAGALVTSMTGWP